MANFQVSYTHKRGEHYAPHERIQGIAGNGGNGWYRSEAEVIDDIDLLAPSAKRAGGVKGRYRWADPALNSGV